MLPLLPLKLLSPLKAAVIECDETPRLEVLNVAVPLELSGAVPSAVVPSLNVTVPVGVPAPGVMTATVAVNVTA